MICLALSGPKQVIQRLLIRVDLNIASGNIENPPKSTQTARSGTSTGTSRSTLRTRSSFSRSSNRVQRLNLPRSRSPQPHQQPVSGSTSALKGGRNLTGSGSHPPLGSGTSLPAVVI